jgi:hypothetical protein
VKLDKSNKEQYKLYVQSVLDANLDALPFDENAAHQKFMGSTSFSGMSKMIGQKWKSADSLTHVTFKELAKKNRDRYKKVRQCKWIYLVSLERGSIVSYLMCVLSFAPTEVV